MSGKWSSGRTETFLDMRAMPVVRKAVLPVAEQERHESRRLWREVTHGLKHNNIEQVRLLVTLSSITNINLQATEGKVFLEQKQRDEAKERKVAGEKWEQRLFAQLGENWTFKQPLSNRHQ